MRNLLCGLLLALVLSSPAVADSYYLEVPQGPRVTLTEEPCTDPAILTHFNEEHHSVTLKGTITTKGVLTPMCFVVMPDGNAYVADQSGPVGYAPVAAFTRMRSM